MTFILGKCTCPSDGVCLGRSTHITQRYYIEWAVRRIRLLSCLNSFQNILRLLNAMFVSSYILFKPSFISVSPLLPDTPISTVVALLAKKRIATQFDWMNAPLVLAAFDEFGIRWSASRKRTNHFGLLSPCIHVTIRLLRLLWFYVVVVFVVAIFVAASYP